MGPPVFASIVEGHGEERALRTLIDRIVSAQQLSIYPMVARPWRIPKGTIVNNPDALERYAAQALGEAGTSGRLFVLVDADDDCPAELGTRLLRRLTARFPHERISVNVANREYESWFIASLESISAPAGIVRTLVIPGEVENIRNAKGWLSDRMPGGLSYNPAADQPRLTSYIDVPAAPQRSQSFDRFCREVERLLAD